MAHCKKQSFWEVHFSFSCSVLQGLKCSLPFPLLNGKWRCKEKSHFLCETCCPKVTNIIYDSNHAYIPCHANKVYWNWKADYKANKTSQRLEKIYICTIYPNKNVVLTWPNCNASYQNELFHFFKSNLIMLTLKFFILFNILWPKTCHSMRKEFKGEKKKKNNLFASWFRILGL